MRGTRRSLRDDRRQRAFAARGVVEVDVLSPPAAEALRERVLALCPGPEAGRWHSSNESPDHAYRDRVHDVLTEALGPVLQALLDDHRLFNAAVLVKWPGVDGAMPAHQDWTFVDESRFRSLTVWCPLEAVDAGNGTLEVLPGSHRVLGQVRCSPQHPEWYDDPAGRLADDDFEVLDLPSGRAAVVDHGLVHRSRPNVGHEPRVVVAAAAAPSDAALEHHHLEDDGRIWSFAVGDPTWFRTFDLGSRPEGLPRRGPTPFDPPSLTAPELVARSRAAVAEAEGDLPRQVGTMVDPGLEERFRSDGYAVVDLLDEAAVHRLRDGYERLDHVEPDTAPFVDGFRTTLYDPRPDHRQAVLDLVEPVFGPALDAVLTDHRLVFANFTVKLAGGDPVPLHLDWTFVDEVEAPSVTVWCALADVDVDDGALLVVPGSHRAVDFVRPVNHRDFAHHERVSSGAPARSLPLRAGQAVVLDNRTVHGSTANASDDLRLAAAAVVARRDASLHHYWLDEDGALVRFDLDRGFYLRYHIGEDPAGVDGVRGRRVLSGVAYA